jgi:hypothetical protein
MLTVWLRISRFMVRISICDMQLLQCHMRVFIYGAAAAGIARGPPTYYETYYFQMSFTSASYTMGIQFFSKIGATTYCTSSTYSYNQAAVVTCAGAQFAVYVPH